MLLEADPQGHFKDRVKDRLDGIDSIEIPSNVYLPDISKDVQDKWIINQINQIKKTLLTKIDAVLAKEYPNKGKLREGICVLVPLGFITIKPIIGGTVKIKINTKENKTGNSYNISIYDNRATTFTLDDPNHSIGRTLQDQLKSHMYNNEKNGWRVNEKESYVDKSFMTSIVIDIKNQKTIPVQ